MNPDNQQLPPPPRPEISFKIEKKQPIPSLPDTTDKTKIDIRYPLMPPYAYAHIFWESKSNELVYVVEEPPLDEREEQVLASIEKGIEELINISFINVKRTDVIIAYLEKNIRVLLAELGITVPEDTFLKLMYYVYRNFVGLNEVEPLLKDYFIEDIECNGVNTPLYLVHRKYRNMRTNIAFKDIRKLASFVEKLAQKCGKYISYASPLLDGRLPDNSRVNATFTEDISTRGPTFTIRKFTSEPFSPIKLMQLKTVSPEVLAYLWLLMEHEANFVVIGGTGSGKCVAGDTKVYLPDGKIKIIKDIARSKFKESKNSIITTNDGWEYVETNMDVLVMDTKDLKIKKGNASKVWRHKAPTKMIKVTTRSGRSITVTPEHPFFTTKNLELIKIRADEIAVNNRIAVPRRFEIENKTKINIMDGINNEKNIYVADRHNEVRNILKVLTERYGLKSQKELAKKLRVSYDSMRFWKYNNAIPLKTYTNLKNLTRSKINKNIKLKAKTASATIILPKITPSLFRFIALVIGDGHLSKTSVEFCNTNKRLLNDFLRLGKKIFSLSGKIEYPKKRTPKAVICSSILAKILNKIFAIPYGNKARLVAVPEVLYQQNDECVALFLQGIVDCESHVSKQDIEISTTSDRLAKSISTLFLRLGVVPRVITRKNHSRVYISGSKNVKTFLNKVGYVHQDKKEAVQKLVNKRISRMISNVDLIPNVSEFIKSFRNHVEITQKELANCIHVSRRLIGMWESGYRQPSIHTFNKLNQFIDTDGYFEDDPFYHKIDTFAESDIFWDEVSNIEILSKHNERYVYDLTVDDVHNFLAGDIPMVVHNTSMLNSLAFFIPPQARIVSIEDTHELMLRHENWLPSVARQATGVGAEGKLGEVDLFTLLKESFRQRPDYVIVGEVRGKEAFVLFQGAASGHATACTMHAEDVETMVRRLETPPINLSPSLIEIIDVICVMAQVKVKGEPTRRLKSIVEIGKVERSSVKTNTPFVWDPKSDTFFFKTESMVFNKLVKNFGISMEELQKEFNNRTKLLMELYKRKIIDFKQVQDIINAYYKTPGEVLRRFNIT